MGCLHAKEPKQNTRRPVFVNNVFGLPEEIAEDIPQNGKGKKSKKKKKKKKKKRKMSPVKADYHFEEPDVNPKDQFNLSATQRQSIQNSWAEVQARKGSEFSKVFMSNLQITGPTLMTLFRQSKILDTGLEIFTFLTNVTSSLKSPEEISVRINELASRHADYKVNSDYFQPFEKALLSTIKSLNEKQTWHVSTVAWTILLGTMTSEMQTQLCRHAYKLTMDHRQSKSRSGENPLRPPRTSLTEMSLRQRKAITQEWYAFHETLTKEHGVTLLTQLFKHVPEVRNLFPRDVGTVGLNMLKSITRIIDLIHDSVALGAYQLEIAQTHIAAKVPASMIGSIAGPLMHLIKEFRATKACDEKKESTVDLSQFQFFTQIANGISGLMIREESKLLMTTGQRNTLISEWDQVAPDFPTRFMNFLAKDKRSLECKYDDIQPFFIHQDRVVTLCEGITTLLTLTSNLTALKEHLSPLYSRHLGRYGVTPEHFTKLTKLITEVTLDLLGNDCTETDEELWTSIWGKILNLVNTRNYDEGVILSDVSESWFATPENNMLVLVERTITQFQQQLPETAQLFTMESEAMSMAFIRLLSLIVTEFPTNRLKLTLRLATGRHVAYGVKAEHYGCFLNLFLGNVLQEEEPAKCPESWKAFCRLIEERMRDAHEEALAGFSPALARDLGAVWNKLPADFKDGSTLFNELLQYSVFKERLSGITGLGKAIMCTVRDVSQAVHEGDTSRVRTLLDSLGKLHRFHTITPEEYDAFGYVFLSTLSCALGREYSQGMWLIYNSIATALLRENKSSTGEVFSTPERKSSLLDKFLNPAEKSAIKEAIEVLSREKDELATAIYAKVAEKKPKLTESLNKMKKRELVKVLLKCAEDYAQDSRSPKLTYRLGEMHYKSDIDIEAYPVLLAAVVETVPAMVPGGENSPTQRSAWAKVVNNIEGSLFQGHIWCQYRASLQEFHKNQIATKMTWDSSNQKQVVADFMALLEAKIPHQNLSPMIEGDMFIKKISEILSCSDTIKLIRLIENLGTVHSRRYGVTSSDFNLVGETFTEALRTAEARSGWTEVFRFISQIVGGSLKQPKGNTPKSAESPRTVPQTSLVSVSPKKDEKSSPPSRLSIRAISKCNTRQNCWLIINDQQTNVPNAYDVTKWLSTHPGGASTILKWGGKECTKPFTKVHSQSAWSQLQKWYQGPVDD